MRLCKAFLGLMAAVAVTPTANCQQPAGVSRDQAETTEYDMAISRYERGEERAVDDLTGFINRYPASHLVPQAWASVGDYYFYRGKYGEAIKAYGNVPAGALETASELDVVYRKGYSLLRLGEWDDARHCFDRLSATARYREAGFFYQGYIHYVNKEYREALDRLGSIRSNGELAMAAQYYVCQIHFAQGRYTDAIAEGRRILAHGVASEYDGELHRIIGEGEFHEGNDTDAARHIEAYIEAYESDPERTSLYILGVLDYRSHEPQACIAHMSGVTAADDALAQSAYLYIGQSQLQAGNLNSAAIAFEQALRMPFDRDVQETAFFNYAITQSDGGRTPFNRSIDIFEDFLNTYPNSRYTADVENYLIDAYTSGNDYRRALESISHIKSPSQRVLAAKQRVLYNLGVQSLSGGSPAEAEAHFTQAYAMGDLDAGLRWECSLWAGECQYRQGRHSDAEASQARYLRNASTADDNYALAHYNIGYSRFQQRKYGTARDAYRVAASSPSLAAEIRADAYNRIGDTYYYSRSYSEAADAYDQAYSTHSQSAGEYALYQKAMMQGLNKDYAAKVGQLDRLMAEFPGSQLTPAALLQRADACVAMNDNQSAIATYDNLIARFPATADARKGMLQKAITERNMGREDDAIATYRRIITQYPASDEATVAVEDLKIIYAERGELAQFADFLASVDGAPSLDVSEMERLTFEAAEKSYVTGGDASRLHDYIGRYPDGVYTAKALYYIARNEYKSGDLDDALAHVNSALAASAGASFTEDALAMKGNILLGQEKTAEALAAYEELLQVASTPDNKINANLGIMRASMELGQWSNAEASAARLLQAGGLSADEEKEAQFDRAMAQLAMGRGSEAAAGFKELASNTQSVYGARAAFELAAYHYQAGNLDAAEQTLNDFIDAGTQHQYWLARGFILLADVYHKRGEDFEACQYLESLRRNYPGRDDDIRSLIDSRLNEWGNNE